MSKAAIRRAAIGLVVRILLSTAVSLTGWLLFITPFDRLPLPSFAVSTIVHVLDFPVALAGELLPIRGIDLIFHGSATWCDFCSNGELFRMQMRIAIPVYLILLYVPTLLMSIARREPRLFRRMVIGLLIYALFTTAWFLATGEDRPGDIRIAAMWLLILSAAAAVAWSHLTERWKAAGVILVLLLGAWAFPFMMTFIAPKMDEVRPYYVSYLLLLTFGVCSTLWLTWVVEQGVDRWRRRHLEVT